jgi:hypothetical protein
MGLAAAILALIVRQRVSPVGPYQIEVFLYEDEEEDEDWS